MNTKKITLATIFVVTVTLFFFLDLQQYLSFSFVKSQQAELNQLYIEQPVIVIAVYFAIYILVTGLSLPGAAIMTLFGGALFGTLTGIIIVSFASTIGATGAFLFARHVFRDSVQQRFGSRLTSINHGVEKDGAFYLFALRLVPAFPFFMINLLMGLTTIKTWTFFWVSQIGMLAGTVVYVSAGTELGKLESLSGILSPGLIIAFTVLGIFPLLARKILDVIKAQRIYKGWRKPKHFDSNIVVIGAGAAGLVSAYIAAAVKAKVTLIEKHKMGGDCLNTGCVPSKALIRTAKFMSHMTRHKEFGIKSVNAELDFSQVMARVQDTIKAIEPHDSVERYSQLGVDCVLGDATIASPWSVEVNGKNITTRSIIIAAGAQPFIPDIPGIDDVAYYTSDTIWGLTELPQRLLVIGGGPIGCELTQAFQRLGSQVTQVELGKYLMPREDHEISETIKTKFISEGIDVRTSHRAIRIENSQLICEHDNQETSISFDALLISVGRVARTEGYGLENINIDLDDRRTIDTNEFLQTRYPNIYACGDVAGPFQFTHTAAHQAWYAAVNSLFGLKKFKADYSVIPWATFTDPEVARVGLNEQEAIAQNIPHEITTYGIDDLDRAIADSEAHGMVKILTEPGKDKILGVTIVGEHAGDLISEFVLAMRHGLGLNKILSTIHIYPTLAEANKYAAGNWKKAHAPEMVLRVLERYHQWRRG